VSKKRYISLLEEKVDDLENQLCNLQYSANKQHEEICCICSKTKKLSDDMDAAMYGPPAGLRDILKAEVEAEQEKTVNSVAQKMFNEKWDKK
jgi:hypothetical protein